MMKPQDAAVFALEPGGNLAIKMHAMRKQTYKVRD
jgi:hypothetical protein